MKAFADLIRLFVGRRYRVLGTDGYGRSDFRRKLRQQIEVDRHYVSAGALAASPRIDMRRGGANEVVEAWRFLMSRRHEPVALVLSRQPLPTLDRSRCASAAGVTKGAYALAGDPAATREAIPLASGSEVSLAVAANEQLTEEGVAARVMSMPSMHLFNRRPQSYRDEVLPPAVTALVSVEKGATLTWDRWFG
jgi:transketolase